MTRVTHVNVPYFNYTVFVAGRDEFAINGKRKTVHFRRFRSAFEFVNDGLSADVQDHGRPIIRTAGDLGNVKVWRRARWSYLELIYLARYRLAFGYWVPGPVGLHPTSLTACVWFLYSCRKAGTSGVQIWEHLKMFCDLF